MSDSNDLDKLNNDSQGQPNNYHLNGYNATENLHPFEGEGPQKGGKKSKAKNVKVVKGSKGPNKWLVHVANVKAANPEMSYKEVLVHAKGSYIKS